jgi:hypothetical protein
MTAEPFTALPPLGDLTIFSPALATPRKLLKACAIIARDLHPQLQIAGYRSHGQCILTALTVRDFLQDIGFRSARVAPVAFAIHAERDGKVLHQLMIGAPTTYRENPAEHWNGHLVVTVDGFLIDASLHLATRTQWPVLTGMAMVPINTDHDPRKSTSPLAGFTCAEGDTMVTAAWLARTSNSGWTFAPDTNIARRSQTVAVMATNFGPWMD